jgi:plastocyanin
MIRAKYAAGLWLAASVANLATAQTAPMAHDSASHQGMVMNHNVSTLPRDCAEISAEYEFTVHAGTRFSADFPGTIFGYDTREFAVTPCSRVTVTFVNDDAVRHQWMVHGLPRYLYPAGMFHLEANGGASQTGTFIVPSDARTYLIHCDLTQHMEKGMKAQLVVGRGSGDLWAIPGVSAGFNRDAYPMRAAGILIALAAALGAGLALGLRRLRKT